MKFECEESVKAILQFHFICDRCAFRNHDEVQLVCSCFLVRNSITYCTLQSVLQFKVKNSQWVLPTRCVLPFGDFVK